jgi:hypothetical protein
MDDRQLPRRRQPRAIAETIMQSKGDLLPQRARVRRIDSTDMTPSDSSEVLFTRDHEVIKQWAAARRAEPATGEATSSGPASAATLRDGGAGVRFNFPGVSPFRPISWDEWLENFDHHQCAFVYENDSSMPLNSRYRIVKADEWKDLLS